MVHMIRRRKFVSATGQPQDKKINSLNKNQTICHSAARFARSRNIRVFTCLSFLLILRKSYFYGLSLRNDAADIFVAFGSFTNTSSSLPYDDKFVASQTSKEMNTTTSKKVNSTQLKQVHALDSKEVTVASEIQNGNDAPKASHAQATRQRRNELNKIILSTAQVMDLQYVNVTGGHQNHPHLGAFDEFGNSGYIYDEKALRKNPIPFNITIEELKCNNKTDSITQVFRERVFINVSAHENAEILTTKGSGAKEAYYRTKLLCIIYTTEPYHDRIPAIRETWGQKCDGFMAVSNVTDKELGTVNIPHEGPESYDNMWQKVRSMWSYVYDNYYQDYDWFHIGGDDMYVLVENLRLYLESEEIQLAASEGHLSSNKITPLYLGQRFKHTGDPNNMYNAGGSGYTINKATLKALVVDCFPGFFPHRMTSEEDLFTARCLKSRFGVYPLITTDDEGGERYLHVNPIDILENVPNWYKRFLTFPFKPGLDHFATRSISFHYIQPNLMKRIHGMLYGWCR